MLCAQSVELFIIYSHKVILYSI